MKYLSKFVAIASTVMVLALATFSLSSVMADTPGQIEGGPIYRIQNITQKSAFVNPATANKCDVLEYSAQLHNSGYNQLASVLVSVNLPGSTGMSNTSTLTTTAADGVPTTTTATATVNLTTSQSVSYVSGTTQLLDQKGNLIKNLPDGITAGGVNIGSLEGSTIEYVNFEAKVSCPTVPVTPVTPTPPVLVNTGPGAVVGIFAVTSILAAVAYRLFGGRFARTTE